MGHDISIRKYDFPEGIVSLHITYNLGDMYYAAMKKCGYGNIESLGEYINGKKLKDLKEFFNKLHNELINNPKKYKKFNPKNGWGSYNGLVKNLQLLIIASNEKPNSILDDWY